ncbi:hypothetical protein [Streptomyces sp. NPDC014995]|uniref:hypothetical protein n=1 Tax=Streptomyces sp. NPDC014995 TaxID=3364936 RepID=UPI0036F7F3CF
MTVALQATLCSGLRQAERLTAQYGADLGTMLTWAEATQTDHLLCVALALRN